jgi:hypothetical protein
VKAERSKEKGRGESGKVKAERLKQKGKRRKIKAER